LRKRTRDGTDGKVGQRMGKPGHAESKGTHYMPASAEQRLRRRRHIGKLFQSIISGAKSSCCCWTSGRRREQEELSFPDTSSTHEDLVVRAPFARSTSRRAKSCHWTGSRPDKGEALDSLDPGLFGARAGRAAKPLRPGGEADGVPALALAHRPGAAGRRATGRRLSPRTARAPSLRAARSGKRGSWNPSKQ